MWVFFSKNFIKKILFKQKICEKRGIWYNIKDKTYKTRKLIE